MRWNCVSAPALASSQLPCLLLPSSPSKPPPPHPQELVALFSVIERTEDAVNRGAAAARAAAERLDALQAGYDQRYPEGMAKLTSWFGAKTRVADAPVKLPPFDPASARINVDGELEVIRGAVGVTRAVKAETLSAFLAETEGLQEEAEEDAAAAGEGAGAATSTEASGTGISAAPRGGGGGVKAFAAGEDDEEDEDDDDDDEEE
jgi:hypothetical protein